MAKKKGRGWWGDPKGHARAARAGAGKGKKTRAKRKAVRKKLVRAASRELDKTMAKHPRIRTLGSKQLSKYHKIQNKIRTWKR